MKRTPLKRIGKIGRINQKVFHKARQVLMDHEKYTCEIRIPGKCTRWADTIAHRHKRDDYKGHPDYPDIMWDFKQIAWSCLRCHIVIEQSRELTEKKFMELRGPE